MLLVKVTVPAVEISAKKPWHEPISLSDGTVAPEALAAYPAVVNVA
jgi:hypothetical protein